MTFTRKLILAILTTSLLSGCGKRESDSPASAGPAAGVNATNPPRSTIATHAPYERLTGRWLRPDGDYILEFLSVASDGKMEAGYFNPQPIRVARAEASAVRGSTRVVVELRDVNYPGSTYTLTYDPGTDRLTGTYYQAVAGETYDVFFVRMKP
jgi:hypothetical protein